MFTINTEVSMSDFIADIRRDYDTEGLHESDLTEDPFEQFGNWFAEAAKAEGSDVNIMTLATATPEGKPSARIVLLKGVDEGFVFYTNYNSHKGNELTENPHAALVFWWASLARQVRIEGRVEKVSAEESDAYFRTRPRGSQIGAVASPQSTVIESRTILEDRVRRVDAQYAESDTIPRPESWGGFRLRPTLIEFWQGRTSRLHDRLQYRKEGKTWIVERLGP